MHLNLRRRDAARMLAVGASFAAHDTPAVADDDDDGGYRHGKSLISTNAPSWNALQVYARSAPGPASMVASLPTGGIGAGAGAGLDSQGAVSLGTSGRYLFVVNAGYDPHLCTEPWRAQTEVDRRLQRRACDQGDQHDGVVYVPNAPIGGNTQAVAVPPPVARLNALPSQGRTLKALQWAQPPSLLRR